MSTDRLMSSARLVSSHSSFDRVTSAAGYQSVTCVQCHISHLADGKLATTDMGHITETQTKLYVKFSKHISSFCRLQGLACGR